MQGNGEALSGSTYICEVKNDADMAQRFDRSCTFSDVSALSLFQVYCVKIK